MPWRKYISVPYLKWLFWAIMAAFWVNIFLSARYGLVLRWSVLVGEAEQLIWALLGLTLFLSLARKLFPGCATLVRVLPLRKYSVGFSLFAFSAYLLLFLIKSIVQRAWPTFLSEPFFSSSFIFTAFAFFFLFMFFVLSTEWAVKNMKMVAWSWLNKMAHLAFILVGLSLVLIQQISQILLLFSLALYALGYMALGLKMLWLKTKIQGSRFYFSDPLDLIH